MLRDLAALRWLEAGESVILYGPVGVGKTHVAQALGHQVARCGGDIRFVKCSRMLADLAGGHADRTIGQRMREYTPAPWSSSSTPLTATPSNRAGSAISTRRPSAWITVLAVFHDTASASATRATLRCWQTFSAHRRARRDSLARACQEFCV
jgi:hypothetical protein